MKRNTLALLLALGYILGIHRGYVALWEGDDPVPRIVTRMPAALLPQEDQARLHKGMPIPEDYPLTRVLEDFCS